MAGSVIVKGHGRKILLSQIGVASQGATVNFGQFDVGQYSKISGFVDPGTGSATFRTRTGIFSGGPFAVSSSVVCSAVTVIDAANCGRYVKLDFSAVQSTATYGLIVVGEPLR